MRGKRPRQRRGRVGRRIIPAHAGQTWICRPGSLPAPDHPRACGANLHFFGHNAIRAGSSPRMRGKPEKIIFPLVESRIIPAHAGQTSARARATSSDSDHPRACGANVALARGHLHGHGSSPRMRGKRFRLARLLVQLRIIPAHAGQTMAFWSLLTSTPDHPRACGANLIVLHHQATV